MLQFHLVTLFEEACDAYLQASILGRARADKKIAIAYQNPRDYVENKWGKAKSRGDRPGTPYLRVDERPYGGGPGMVMQAMPVVKAVEKALGKKAKKPVIIWFSPSAKQFTNKDADALAKYSDVVLVCGRYEGIDERAKKLLKTLGTVKEFAVGEATYTGGEVPAMAIVDAITRRIPGVLGKDASVEERRIAASAVYTRPDTISYKKKNYKVPAVLKSGHQANIDKWRSKQ